MNRDKPIRLIEFLQKVTELRTKVVRDVKSYDRVLWFADLPRQRGCFTQAWGREEGHDPDIWIEVQSRREPEIPAVPSRCKNWADTSSLRNKEDLPELRKERTKEVKNPNWREEKDQPEFITVTELLDDFPDVQEVWDQYLEQHWILWVERHNEWEPIQKVYSELFAIHQEQLRLSEHYELVVGLGLLTWRCHNDQKIRRHLIVADAILEFDAELGRFAAHPHPDGARLRPELNMMDVEDQPQGAEKIAQQALAGCDDPWEKEHVEGVLKSLVHSINPAGKYDNCLKNKEGKATGKPLVEFAPALILRRRSTRSFSDVLTEIKELRFIR